MATAHLCEWSDFDAGKAMRLTERIMRQLGSQSPAGMIYHAEGPTSAGGWWTFNVWESEEAYPAFREHVLLPALDAEGLAHGEVRQLPLQWESSRQPSAS